MNILGMRPVALLASLVAVAAALAFLFGSGPSAPHGAQAAGTPTASVSCADVYQDILNNTPLGNPHQVADDIPAANSMSRIEPSQTSPGNFDLTTVTYLGPDLVLEDEPDIGIIPADAVPDVMPALVPCATAAANANTGAELTNAMHALHDPENQYGRRPGSIARFGTYTPGNSEDGVAGATCGDGQDNGDSGLLAYTLASTVSQDALDTDCYTFPGGSPDTLVTSNCNFSESSTGWGRTDTFSKIVSKTAKGVNYGKNVLMIATAAPGAGFSIDTNGDGVKDEATDPSKCTGGLAFPSISESTIREPSTDEPGLIKNTTNSIPTDPSGASGIDTADGLADDYDGDGCTDWDELDKGFTGTYPVSVTGPVHGTDPFNPADCDQNFNSTVAISVIARHNESTCAAPSAVGGCQATIAGNGNYFRCIGDLTDPKGAGTRAVSLRMSCYSDSPITTVNPSYADAAGNATCPPAPANMCGDGQSGGTPPGSTNPCHLALPIPPFTPCAVDRASKPYQDIDAVNYPIATSGTYDKGANTLTVGGCFVGYAAPPIGPNLYGSGSFDTRTGAGTFVVRFGIPNSDPCDASHGVNACVLMPGGVCTATIVELASKKNLFAPATSVTITRTGTVATVTTTPNHGLSNSCPVISGADQAAYNGPHAITVTGLNTFTYTVTGSPATPATGTITYSPMLCDTQHRNSDRDGCTDTQELRSVAALGGLRDPFNDYDYFNPTGDKLNRVDDILAVVNQYFINDPPGQIDYASVTDRTAITGANAWNLGPPDGLQTVADILAAVKSYFHDCNT